MIWVALGLVDDNKHQEEDHCQKYVDDVHQPDLVDGCLADLLLAVGISTLSDTLCLFHFLLQSDPCQGCNITSLQGIVQCLSRSCFTALGGLQFLP